MTEGDHRVIRFEINGGRGGEVLSVGEVLEGDDGVEVS
jgi:hypothetical protein